MKRLWPFLLSLLLVPAVALAMTQSSSPPKFPIPWGADAGSAYINSIPVPSQIGVTNCRASLTDGWPPLTFVPSTAGGCPPFGADFNGILKQTTQWSQWQGAGAPVLYDSAFSASIGGYPNGAILVQASTAGCFWLSTADNNLSDPDTGGANWTGYCPANSGGGTAATSTGTANAQVVTTQAFNLQVGSSVTYIAGFTNTGPLQVNVNGGGLKNVYRRSQLGATMSVGGEAFVGQIVQLQWDGMEWQCMSAPIATVGEIKTFTGSTAPAGWAFTDGRCGSQTTYADFYAVAGSSYGSCGAGLFAFPDGRGRGRVALDNQGTNGNASRMAAYCASTTLGAVCGAQNQGIAQTNLPAVNFTNSGIALHDPGHNHGVSDPGHFHGINDFGHFHSGPGDSFVIFTGTGGSLSINPGTNAGTSAITAGATTGITIQPSTTGISINSNTTGITVSAQGTAASGGSGTALETVPPVQFSTEIVKL